MIDKQESFQTRTFPRSLLFDDLGLPHDHDPERVTVIRDTIADASRWSIIHVLIFELDGQTYRAIYSVGATEMQDERPWEYEEQIKCHLVEPRQMIVTEYLQIPVKS